MSLEVGEQMAVERTRGANAFEQGRTLAGVLHNCRLLLSASWLGASLFFSFVVAPSVFVVLRDSTALYANHLAGTIITRNLAVINTSGFVISLFLLASAVAFRGRTGRRSLLAEIISVVIVAAATGAGQWVIAARMLALRQQMGRPIDETAATDPLRLAFNSLHVYSVTALTIAMLAALVAFILIARSRMTVR
jgi:hypothetical protein